MTTKVPTNLLYTEEHEWALVENDIVTVGITDHAQHQLGDVVYLELPDVGTTLTKDKRFGVVESVKAVSDLFAPASGEVIETNSSLVDTPEHINQDTYASWMIKVKVSSPSELSKLLSPTAYEEYLAKHSK